MLAYMLALVVGLGSFGLYMAAFFFPEVHRKNDFIWSGVGLFYALVLWVCAGRMTGGVLLGQLAVVALLGWFGWQMLWLRRQLAPLDQQTPLPTAADLQGALSQLASPEGRSQLTQQTVRTFGQLKEGVQGAIATTGQAQARATNETYVPPSLDEFGTAGQEAIERFARVAIPPETTVSEVAAGVQETVETAIADLQTQGTTAQEAVTTAATAASRAIASATSPTPANPTLPQQVTALFQSVVASVKSLFAGGTQPPVSQPPVIKPAPTAEVPPQPSQPYVRKKFREAAGDAPANSSAMGQTVSTEAGAAPASQPYVRKKYRDAASSPDETAVSQPYVRKKYRNEETPPSAQPSATPGVYVRKKYRPVASATDAVTASDNPLPNVTDATVISVTEEITRTADGALVAEAVIEIESETLAPDLLANAMIVTSTADPNATVEDIVEELLEDISVQEEVFGSGHEGEAGSEQE